MLITFYSDGASSRLLIRLTAARSCSRSDTTVLQPLRLALLATSPYTGEATIALASNDGFGLVISLEGSHSSLPPRVASLPVGEGSGANIVDKSKA